MDPPTTHTRCPVEAMVMTEFSSSRPAYPTKSADVATVTGPLLFFESVAVNVPGSGDDTAPVPWRKAEAHSDRNAAPQLSGSPWGRHA